MIPRENYLLNLPTSNVKELTDVVDISSPYILGEQKKRRSLYKGFTVKGDPTFEYKFDDYKFKVDPTFDYKFDGYNFNTLVTPADTIVTVKDCNDI